MMADSQTFEQLEDELAAEEAGGVVVPRERLEDTEMDITPMIDCTFLLLIFFLLTFKADEGATVHLPPARYGVPVPAKNAVVLTVLRGDAERPAQVFLGNTTDTSALANSSDLQALEDQITAFVEREASRTRKDFVLIKAAEDVKHRDIARVTRAASRVQDIDQLHVAVLEVQ